MASNHEDQHISKKLLSLQDQAYDTQGGWEQLASQLEARQLTATKNPPAGRVKPLWKMAAATVLLALGFFAGRLSTAHRQVVNVPVQSKSTRTLMADRRPTTRPHPLTAKKAASDTKKAKRQTIDLPKNTKQFKKSALDESKTLTASLHEGQNEFRKPKVQIPSIKNPSSTNTKVLPTTTNRPLKDVIREKYALITTEPPISQESAISVKTLQSEKNIRTVIHKEPQPSLPVMGLAEINMTPSGQPSDNSAEGFIKTSVYKKSATKNGSFSNNPFKIRL